MMKISKSSHLKSWTQCFSTNMHIQYIEYICYIVKPGDFVVKNLLDYCSQKYVLQHSFGSSVSPIQNEQHRCRLMVYILYILFSHKHCQAVSISVIRINDLPSCMSMQVNTCSISTFMLSFIQTQTHTKKTIPHSQLLPVYLQPESFVLACSAVCKGRESPLDLDRGPQRCFSVMNR